MASPDFTPYVDLTIYDVDPYQVYDDAITYAQTSVPEFQPRLGTVEEAIIQAVVYNTSRLIASINRLPNGLMEGIARLTGLTRNEATFATGTVQFTIFGSMGATIPSGTVFAYQTISDDIVTSYPFETTADLIIAPATTTGTVAMRATTAGQYPALLNNQEFELVSPAATVTQVVLVGDLNIGSNAETDTEYFNRAVSHFRSLSSALTTRLQMSNYIRANYANASYSYVFDLTDSTALSFDPNIDPPAPGYVTVVAISPTGAALSTGDKTTLEEDLASKAVAGLVIDAIDPNPIGITATVVVSILDGFDTTMVKDAVEAKILDVVSYKQYDFSGRIRKNELISALSQISGVKYIASLVFSETTPSSYASIDGTTGDVLFTEKNCVPVPTALVS